MKTTDDAAGNSVTRFAYSLAIECPGMCLAHFREGINAVRCHFVDGRVASILPEKVETSRGGTDVEEQRWNSQYARQAKTELDLALIPCMTALSKMTKPPKIYRMCFKGGHRRLAIGINKEVVRSLRKMQLPAAPPTALPHPPPLPPSIRLVV